jgi:hypothetical protein
VKEIARLLTEYGNEANLSEPTAAEQEQALLISIMHFFMNL